MLEVGATLKLRAGSGVFAWSMRSSCIKSAVLEVVTYRPHMVMILSFRTAPLRKHSATAGLLVRQPLAAGLSLTATRGADKAGTVNYS